EPIPVGGEDVEPVALIRCWPGRGDGNSSTVFRNALCSRRTGSNCFQLAAGGLLLRTWSADDHRRQPLAQTDPSANVGRSIFCPREDQNKTAFCMWGKHLWRLWSSLKERFLSNLTFSLGG